MLFTGLHYVSKITMKSYFWVSNLVITGLKRNSDPGSLTGFFKKRLQIVEIARVIWENIKLCAET